MFPPEGGLVKELRKHIMWEGIEKNEDNMSGEKKGLNKIQYK